MMRSVYFLMVALLIWCVPSFAAPSSVTGLPSLTAMSNLGAASKLYPYVTVAGHGGYVWNTSCPATPDAVFLVSASGVATGCWVSDYYTTLNIPQISSSVTGNGAVFNFFNSNWTSPNQFVTTSVNPHGYGSASLAVSRTSAGSGTAGPPYTDAAIFAKSIKSGVLTDPTPVGEIDGVYSYVQQHGVGDAGALLGQADIVGVSGGGAVAIEGTGNRLNTSGAVTLTSHFIGGYISSGETTSISGDFEGWVGPNEGIRIGTLDLHAGTAGPAPTMLTALRVRNNRDDAQTLYRLTGPDDPFPGASYYGSPAANMGMWYSPGASEIIFLNTNGAAGVALLDQTGNFTSAGRTESLTYVKTHPYTVAGLNSAHPAATVGAGAMAYVTDASGPTFNTTVVGGGLVGVLVVSDGSTWKAS